MSIMLGILVCAIGFQLAATLLALRLILITGRSAGWLLIAAAVALMTVRRVDSLVMVLSGAPVSAGNFQFEIIGLLLSILMFAGMVRISPIFQEISADREKLRAANNALDLLNHEQKVMLDHSSDFIYHHNPQGDITYASPAVERITGFSVQEWCGHFSKFYTDNPANKVGLEMTEAICGATRDEISYRVQVRHKNGGAIWLEVNKQAYKADGKVAGVIGVARDISRRVRLEEEREKLIVELREAMAKIRTLKDMLPICASCKKIRDDKGYWKQIESYIREHTDTEFTHSICPECARTLYPELYAAKDEGEGRS